MFERAMARAGDSLKRGLGEVIGSLCEALVDMVVAGMALMVALALAITSVVLWAVGICTAEVAATVAVVVLLALTLAARAPGGWVARRGLQEAGDLAIALEVAALTLITFGSSPYTWMVLLAAFAMAHCSDIR